MDLRDKWKINHQSICSIEHYNDKTKIASGTGFRINKFIITNNHVYHCESATHTIVKFVEKDSKSIAVQKKYSKEEFQRLLVAGDNADNWDYAILNADNDFTSIPKLVLCEKEFPIDIGSEIYFLGFPLLSDNLTITGGVISSKYLHESKVKYIQIDASVNSGNSGGALFDFKTDKIIGIVTRKNTGLTKNFNELKKSFADNILNLENASKMGGVQIMGIDPLGGLKIIQSQMNLLSDEMFRSSNVGIGYAFELEEIRKGLN